MLGRIARVTYPLPPLRARKYPWLALVLGLLPSAVALGICFRTWTNVIAPTVAWLVPAINGASCCVCCFEGTRR